MGNGSVLAEGATTRVETGGALCASRERSSYAAMDPTESLSSARTIFIDKLVEAGVTIDATAEGIRVKREGDILPVDIRTAPYPGFPTDMQAQMMTLLCLSSGRSVIEEKVFENRFMHVAELQRMGAKISVRGSLATVTGVDGLSGAKVMATDLRASASLVLAGLAASGLTEVLRIYHIDRGYEDIVSKLSSVGARIKRVPGTA